MQDLPVADDLLRAHGEAQEERHDHRDEEVLRDVVVLPEDVLAGRAMARSVELQGTQKLDATENMEVVLMPAPEALARAETGRLFVQALHLSALFLASRRHPELFT